MGARRNAAPQVRPGAIIAAICSYLIVCVAIGAISHRPQPWRAAPAAADGTAAGPPQFSRSPPPIGPTSARIVMAE